MRTNATLASVAVVIIAQAGFALSDEVKSGGSPPAELTESIKKAVEKKETIKHADWTKAGGWIVITDKQMFGGGKRPQALEDFLNGRFQRPLEIEWHGWPPNHSCLTANLALAP